MILSYNKCILVFCQVPKKNNTRASKIFGIPTVVQMKGEGNGNLLQYSCLENPKDRGAWHGVTRAVHDLATKPLPPSPQMKGAPFVIDNKPL